MHTAENGPWLGRRPRDQIATKGPVTHGFAWAAPRRMLVPILETQAEETQGVAVRDKTPVLGGCSSFAPSSVVCNGAFSAPTQGLLGPWLVAADGMNP